MIISRRSKKFAPVMENMEDRFLLNAGHWRQAEHHHHHHHAQPPTPPPTPNPPPVPNPPPAPPPTPPPVPTPPPTPAPPPVSGLPTPIAGTNYQLVFQDNFPGTSVNPANWNQVGPWGHPVASNWSNFSYPSEHGDFSAVSVSNGTVSITAKNTGGNWTGGILSTNGLHQWQYGYFQVTAKLPAGQGYWPGIWLYGSDSSNDELDMLESVGGGNTAYQTVHDASGSEAGQAVTNNPTFTTSFHTYGMLWTPTSITFFIDGVKTGTVNANINEPMYLMLDIDLAGPGQWGGPPDSSTPPSAALTVSNVQVYQLPA
jgi:beta-glucanase (GH16 family)